MVVSGFHKYLRVALASNIEREADTEVHSGSDHVTRVDQVVAIVERRAEAAYLPINTSTAREIRVHWALGGLVWTTGLHINELLLRARSRDVR